MQSAVEKWLKGKNKGKLFASYQPERLQLERVLHEGQAAEYTIPKGWIKVKTLRVMSEK